MRNTLLGTSVFLFVTICLMLKALDIQIVRKAKIGKCRKLPSCKPFRMIIVSSN